MRWAVLDGYTGSVFPEILLCSHMASIGFGGSFLSVWGRLALRLKLLGSGTRLVEEVGHLFTISISCGCTRRHRVQN